MKNLIYVVFLLICCSACKQNEKPTNAATETQNEIAFDEAKWKTKEGEEYPFRELMLKDLMQNQDLRKLKKDEILKLLGEPNKIDTNYLFYTVEQKKLGFWPISTKTMVIHFNEDQSVKWIKTHGGEPPF